MIHAYIGWIGATLALGAVLAHADEQSDCAAGKGTLLVGQVVQGPIFAKGKPLKGVNLTHTHIGLKVNGQDAIYDVAIDNVFAADFVKNSTTSPASLMAIQVGDHLELCGKLYSPPETGIDWVHTNCGAPPAMNAPNGWIKEVDANGLLGPNLDATQTYCSLWRPAH